MQFGSAAKLPGSGGAVVGLCLDQVRLVRLILSHLKQQCILYALWNHWKRDCVSYFGHFILIVPYKWLIDAQAINCNSVI